LVIYIGKVSHWLPKNSSIGDESLLDESSLLALPVSNAVYRLSKGYI
jgi:hypothetical protein